MAAGSIVADLITAIIDHEAYSSEADIQITCAGKNLSALNSSLTLKKCNLVSGSVVNVAGKLRGGDLATPVQTFVDMENMSTLKTSLLNTGALDPIWRSVCPGLNVDGTCRNSFCEAFEEDVICNKGFVVFNIAEVVHCPVCGSSFMPTTVGFGKCQWMFEGRKAGVHSIDMMSKWHTTNGDLKYEFFDDEGGRNMAEWCSLVITVKPLRGDEVTGGMNMPLKVDKKHCAICFGTLTTGSRISNNVDMACGHGAHSDCKKALQSSGFKHCPTCRGPIAA